MECSNVTDYSELRAAVRALSVDKIESTETNTLRPPPVNSNKWWPHTGTIFPLSHKCSLSLTVLSDVDSAWISNQINDCTHVVEHRIRNAIWLCDLRAVVPMFHPRRIYIVSLISESYSWSRFVLLIRVIWSICPVNRFSLLTDGGSARNFRGFQLKRPWNICSLYYVGMSCCSISSFTIIAATWKPDCIS